MLSVAFCLAGAALGALLGALCRTSRQAGSLGLALAMVLAVFGGAGTPRILSRIASKRDEDRSGGWAMDGFLAVLSPSAATGPALRSTVLLPRLRVVGFHPGGACRQVAPRSRLVTWYSCLYAAC